jgi:malate synthase
VAGQDTVLPAPLLALLVSLHRAVEPGRQARLQARRERQAFFDQGGLPDFRDDTARSAAATGASRRCRPRCRTAASRSPARPTRRWSSTR